MLKLWYLELYAYNSITNCLQFSLYIKLFKKHERVTINENELFRALLFITIEVQDWNVEHFHSTLLKCFPIHCHFLPYRIEEEYIDGTQILFKVFGKQHF